MRGEVPTVVTFLALSYVCRVGYPKKDVAPAPRAPPAQPAARMMLITRIPNV